MLTQEEQSFWDNLSDERFERLEDELEQMTDEQLKSLDFVITWGKK